MTINEFAAKYSVPYHVAYKASFRVRPVATLNRERDYDEQELHTETGRYIRQRLRDTRALYEQYVEAYNNLKNAK